MAKTPSTSTTVRQASSQDDLDTIDPTGQQSTDDGRTADGSSAPSKTMTRTRPAGDAAASHEALAVDAYLESPIAIIGSGGFGTTLAVLLAQKGLEVNQWVRNDRLAFIMQDKRENQKYLPGVTLPLNIYITERVGSAVERAKIVVIAVPSHAVRDAAEAIKPHLTDPDTIIVNVAKGVEHSTTNRMSQVLEEVLGEDRYIVSLSGPNHAEEIGRAQPGATVVASRRPECLPVVCEAFTTDTFKVYPHRDLIGVELAGTMKNIVALATGVCDGLGLGDNTRSALMTLGLHEMTRMGAALGARKETFMGLAGLGDLIATCTSSHSRNRHVGEQLGHGEALDDIIRGMGGKVAEGITATRLVHEYAVAHDLRLPLTRAVYQFLYEDKDLDHCVDELLRLV